MLVTGLVGRFGIAKHMGVPTLELVADGRHHVVDGDLEAEISHPRHHQIPSRTVLVGQRQGERGTEAVHPIFDQGHDGPEPQ